MVRGGSGGRFVAMGIWAAVSCTVMRMHKLERRRTQLEPRGAEAVAVPEVATRRRYVGSARDRSCSATPTHAGEWSASERSVD